MRGQGFIPALLLGLGVLGISGIRQQAEMPPTRPMTSLPLVMDGLAGRDVVIDSAERRIAGMSDYVLREFRRDSALAFSVYVGYYDRQVQGKAIHSPRNCLPGAGWEILESAPVALAAGPGSARANRVLLTNRGVRALVYYWYQGRGRAESSEYTVKWNLLRDAALYGRTEEALVRIVVPVARTAPTDGAALRRAATEADRVATRVAARLVRDVQAVLPPAPGA
jgi:EpsI family protein